MERIRVLLVEHNPATRTLLRDFFCETEQLELVGMAEDGQEGLEAIRRLDPDVVMTELVLPRLSGIGLLQTLAGLPRPKVLVASRVDSPEMIRLALDLGAGFYLIKPINLTELPAILVGLCRRDDPLEAAGRLLLSMGAKEGTQEFLCARAAAVQQAGAEENTQLKAVYLQTARDLGTSPACVEKNIRSLADKLMGLDRPAWRALWQEPLRSRPTNRELLRALARQLRAGQGLGRR